MSQHTAMKGCVYMALPPCEEYTVEDIYNLPEGTRAELIDGQIYYMAPPTRKHQDIAGTLYRRIADYMDTKGGPCRTYISPFAVFLNEDDKNYVEPDVSVICDSDQYTFSDTIKAGIYEDLYIDFSKMDF